METPRYIKRNPLKVILVTWLLTLFFVTYVPSAPAQDTNAPPNGSGDPHFIVVAICFIIGGAVIAVIIWGIWKMCKKIPTRPPPDPDDPPPTPIPTNNPPVAIAPGPSPSPSIAMQTGPGGENGVDWWDIRGRTNAGSYETLMVSGVQSSIDLTNWSPEIYILGWTSRDVNDGVMLVAAYDANWQLLVTRYGDVKTNDFMNVGDIIKPHPGDGKRFYRSFVPQKLHN